MYDYHHAPTIRRLLREYRGSTVLATLFINGHERCRVVGLLVNSNTEYTSFIITSDRGYLCFDLDDVVRIDFNEDAFEEGLRTDAPHIFIDEFYVEDYEEYR